ncbi:hypothetical protein FOZ60_003649 [Perkinsus olseni]|uniref:Uncharacterized protein n=1 Tax=Perkinsus olseni TaxID=32597 RepID=A0A7J6NUZ2_PEROL|nr:hypothetical protein FOZ60_003649 [Perkinsus olseni]
MLKGVYDDIDRAIRDRTYDETCTKAWSDQICETVMKRLKEKWRSFKFMVTCAMMQKNNSTMHAATSCWWEPDSDRGLSETSSVIPRSPESSDVSEYIASTTGGIYYVHDERSQPVTSSVQKEDTVALVVSEGFPAVPHDATFEPASVEHTTHSSSRGDNVDDHHNSTEVTGVVRYETATNSAGESSYDDHPTSEDTGVANIESETTFSAANGTWGSSTLTETLENTDGGDDSLETFGETSGLSLGPTSDNILTTIAQTSPPAESMTTESYTDNDGEASEAVSYSEKDGCLKYISLNTEEEGFDVEVDPHEDFCISQTKSVFWHLLSYT